MDKRFKEYTGSAFVFTCKRCGGKGEVSLTQMLEAVAKEKKIELWDGKIN
jgi:hypothetical protein